MSEPIPNFEEIYHTHYDKVYRVCMGYSSGNTDLANELTQEVFINVWKGLPKFRAASQLSTWLYRIAVNTCLMNLRKKKQYVLKDELEVAADSDTEASPNYEKKYAAMYQCIDALSAMNKAIILMELEGLPQAEIAEVLGINHAAVRTRIHRIKNQLSKCVKNG